MAFDIKESERGFRVLPPPPPAAKAPASPSYDLGQEVPADVMPVPKPTPFFLQLYWTTYKNVLLISRRPIMLFLMLFGSVFSVLLAWAAGPDSEDPLPEFDQCGAATIQSANVINTKYGYADPADIQRTLNENWRNGFPVAILSLGPLVHAVCAFMIVQGEIEKKLLGVLRVLGVRESVYWLSWYGPFFITSLVNSLIAAGVAKMLPVHVFQTVYFGGIFASLFFLQLALVSASFFLAAICGSLKRLLVIVLALMILAVFVPTIIISVKQSIAWDSDEPGLFWGNRNTTESFSLPSSPGYKIFPDLEPTDPAYSKRYNFTFDTCETPILTEEQGTHFKTWEELSRVQADEFMIGCYRAPGFSTEYWNPTDSLGEFVLASLFMSPYFHFTAMYSNFLGYTGMPALTFTAEHASRSPEELAIASWPSSSTEDNANGTSFLPQGSTIFTKNPPNTFWNMRNKEWKDWMNEMNGVGWDEYGYGYTSPSTTFPYVCPDGDRIGFENICNDSSCHYVHGSKVSEGSPSVHDMVGYLLSLAIIYLLMASYWIQVFPAGNGARRSFYFFLVPSYWFGLKPKNQEDGDNAVCIEIKEISKSFGSFKAVENLSLTLRGGEVTALLGHNGAGKSTVINIISCEMPMTTGNVSIFGNSVVDPFAVRQLIGVCKQDDYLWPDLSAKEHLDIFGGLRGVDPEVHDSIVQKWLESVDLTLVKDKFSAAFSGGMKRRLSVALSTIGDRPLIILDEPTTGMDPVSRRYVWKHLDEIKERRVVLLTTHAMEEADLLADEVAIMRKGTLAALGTPLELKTEHGSALQFSILVDKQYTRRTEEKIKDIFNIQSEYVSISSFVDTGNIAVKVKSLDGLLGHNELTEFSSWLESDASDVTEYGFSNSSLEEVFITITKDDIEPDSTASGPEFSTRKGCCCFGDRLVVTSEDNGSLQGGGHSDFDPINHISAFEPRLTLRNQVDAWVRQSFLRKWRGKRSIGEYIFFGIMILLTICIGFIIASAGGREAATPLLSLPAVALSLMLPSIVFPFYHDKMTGLLHLMQTQGLQMKSFLLGSACYSFAIQFLYGFITLSLFYATPIFRQTQMCEERAIQVCDNYTDYCYTDYEDSCWNRGMFDPPRESGVGVLNPDHNSEVQITAVVTSSGDGYGTLFLVSLIFALATIGASFASSIIPGNYKFAMVMVVFFSLLASFAPMGNFIYFFTRKYDRYYEEDKEEDIYAKCASSLDPQNMCNNLENAVIGSNMTAEYYMDCLGQNMDGFEGNFPALCAPAYFSMLPQVGLVHLITFVLSAEIKFDSDEPGYIENDFIPRFDGVDCSGDTCKIPMIQSSHKESFLFFFLGAILLIILGAALFILTHFTPPLIMSFKLECSRTFSRMFGKLCCSPNKKRHDEYDSNEEVMLSEVIEEKEKVCSIVNPLLRAPPLEHVEDGTQQMVLDRAAKEKAELPPILMRSLRKVYPSSGRSPPKVALNSLDLHVPKGQVLGLLGKNGSGKSTCLNILSATHEPSDGIALVAGYDISTESTRVFEELGSCPQFDIIWPNLSVKDHLVFFARLKGLPRELVQKASHDVANAVGLGSSEVYTRNAGLLSGGMRRRLSIAISVLGAPRVLLLDEPTTGLDPSTRNEVWSLVGAFATSERAVVITTHMMIEADTLCNRIAIIADGKLRVVATQQQLKDRYGCGYTLQLNLVRSSQLYQDSAMAFVRKYINEDAKLDNKQAKTLNVHLPRDQSIGKVFKAMYSPERVFEGGINQFLLQQSSLEDVFISLG